MMLHLHPAPTSIPARTTTIDAGTRLDVHSVPAFEAAVEQAVADLGPIHIDATAVTHLDQEGLRVLTRLAEVARDDVVLTIDAGPAVQIAALLHHNETLAAAVLSASEAVAA